MNLFKNKVGRPSNEVKRKRKLFVIMSLALIVLFAFVLCNVLYKKDNVSQLSAATAKMIKTYTGKELYSYGKKISCESNPKKKNNACKYNKTSNEYWNSNNIKDALNVSASYKGTVSLAEIKIPNNLYDFDEIKIYYYAGTDKSSMEIKVGFSINNSPIKTSNFSNIKLLNNKSGFTERKTITLDLNELKKYINNKSNTDLLKLRVYHDTKTENYSALLKIEKIELIKNAPYLPEENEKKLTTIGDTVSVDGDGITLKSSNEKVLKVVKISENKYGIIALSAGTTKIEVYKNNKKIEEKTYNIAGKLPTIKIYGKIADTYEKDLGFIYGESYFKVTDAPKNSKIIVYSENPEILRVSKKDGKYTISPRSNGETKVIAKLVPTKIGNLNSKDINSLQLANEFINASYAQDVQVLNVSIKSSVVDEQIKEYTNNNNYYTGNINVSYQDTSGKQTFTIVNGKAKYRNVRIYVAKGCNAKQVTDTLPEVLELPKKYTNAINAVIYTNSNKVSAGLTRTDLGIIKMRCDKTTNFKGALSHEIGHAVDGYYSTFSSKMLSETNVLYENLTKEFDSYSKKDKDAKKWPKISPTSSYVNKIEYFASVFATYSQYEILKTNNIDNTPYKGYKTNYTKKVKFNGKDVVLKSVLKDSMKLYDEYTNNYYHQLKMN